MQYENNIQQAVEILQSGGLVGLPTETVYGLAADACNGEAVAQIFNIKGRPSYNPLIVHVSDLQMASRYAHITPLAERLANAYWPAALTLVMPLKQHSGISEKVTASGDTIALRAPAHPVARTVIEKFDGGLAAPSANRSGKISPTTRQHVLDEFGDTAALILEGGACECGLESTVIDVTGDMPILLRTGTLLINAADDEKYLNKQILRSPGQLTAHYAPTVPLRLHAASVDEGEGLLAFGDITSVSGTSNVVQNLSESGNLKEAAHNLFAMLRALDVSGAASIAAMPIPEEGIGIAINDRLRRAAAAHTDTV